MILSCVVFSHPHARMQFHILVSGALQKMLPCNTSIRKYHNHKLAAAGAPTHIQQASQAQNTRFYNAGPKSERMGTKKKIAAVIAGERKAWHSPDQLFYSSTCCSGFQTVSKCIDLCSNHHGDGTNFDPHSQKIEILFPGTQISFEYDV